MPKYVSGRLLDWQAFRWRWNLFITPPVRSGPLRFWRPWMDPFRIAGLGVIVPFHVFKKTEQRAMTEEWARLPSRPAAAAAAAVGFWDAGLSWQHHTRHHSDNLWGRKVHQWFWRPAASQESAHCLSFILHPLFILSPLLSSSCPPSAFSLDSHVCVVFFWEHTYNYRAYSVKLVQRNSGKCRKSLTEGEQIKQAEG